MTLLNSEKEKKGNSLPCWKNRNCRCACAVYVSNQLCAGRILHAILWHVFQTVFLEERKTATEVQGRWTKGKKQLILYRYPPFLTKPSLFYSYPDSSIGNYYFSKTKWIWVVPKEHWNNFRRFFSPNRRYGDRNPYISPLPSDPP